MVEKLSWDRVLAWRMRRQLLDRPAHGTTAAAVVKRLAGVQAQVASSAEQAIAARQKSPRKGEVGEALATKRLVKTWAARGTLHLLDTDDAPAYLSLLAATRLWEKGAWQRSFVDVRTLGAIAEAATAVLDGAVLTREQLTAAIVTHTDDRSIAEHLSSGWGTVLKPLAWQGLLVNGPSQGGRVTFTTPKTYLPGWRGLPEPDEAARLVVPAYLGAYGPASATTFDDWLCRGASKRAALKGWFAALVEDGTLVEVDVEGERLVARAADVGTMATAEPFDEVRLLPAFDQFVLGPGTKDPQIIPAGRRALVSRAAGWIAPVVVHRGRVAGTWEAKDGALDVALFEEAGDVPRDGIAAEADRVDPDLKLRVGTAAAPSTVR